MLDHFLDSLLSRSKYIPILLFQNYSSAPSLFHLREHIADKYSALTRERFPCMEDIDFAGHIPDLVGLLCFLYVAVPQLQIFRLANNGYRGGDD
jgi:hypothetical protein